MSDPFNILVGPAARLSFVEQSGDGTGGSPISVQPRVGVTDAGGNLVETSDRVVSLDLGNNPGGARLSGTTSLRTVSGLAGFIDIGLDKNGEEYTLTAETPGLAVATSEPFDIDVGPPQTLVKISGDEQDGKDGTALEEPFVVRVLDAGGPGLPRRRAVRHLRTV